MTPLPVAGIVADLPGLPEALFRHDDRRAQRVINFIERFCVHTKGEFARRPFLLTAWQKEEIVRPLYGTVALNERTQEWRRQYRIAWIEMARKQGKSELASALALYHLVADGEESAEVYSVAADRDQAALVYQVAKRMVELSPQLSKVVEVVDSRKRLVYRRTNSFYQVLPGDASGALGTNPSAVLFDEVLTQRDRHLWDAMRQGFGTRRQPILIATTTAGYTSADFALAEHEYGEMIKRDPLADPTRFVFQRNVPKDWDWRNEGLPACRVQGCNHNSTLKCGGLDGTGWYYSCPGLGDFFDIETLRGEAKEAELKPAAQNAFRVFRLNQWTAQAVRWIDMPTWDRSGGPIDLEKLAGREAVAALGVTNTADFTVWLLLFRGSPDDPAAAGVTVVPRFWIPAAAIEQRAAIRDRLALWGNQGHLTITPGPTTDYSAMLAQIQRDAEKYRIRMVGYDPYNATQLVNTLDDLGLTVVKVPQTATRINDPCKAVEVALAEGSLRHGNHPVLRWMADNTELDHTAEGLMKPSRTKSGDRIDGITALVTALFVDGLRTEVAPPVGFLTFDGIEGNLSKEEHADLQDFLRELDDLDDD